MFCWLLYSCMKILEDSHKIESIATVASSSPLSIPWVPCTTSWTAWAGHGQSCAIRWGSWWHCRSFVWQLWCCRGWWPHATSHQAQTLSLQDVGSTQAENKQATHVGNPAQNKPRFLVAPQTTAGGKLGGPGNTEWSVEVTYCAHLTIFDPGDDTAEICQKK